MIVISMLLSGAVAGLVGLPILFGSAYNYGSTFQSGLGFAGIAIALLGRNNAIGIALGALLFAFLDEQSNPPPDRRRRVTADRRDHPRGHRARRGHRLRGGRAAALTHRATPRGSRSGSGQRCGRDPTGWPLRDARP
jgi:hypothetical protein